MEETRPIWNALISLSLPSTRLGRVVRLWSEGFALAGMGVLVMLAWGVGEAGTLSTFLVAASLGPRLRHLLADYRKALIDGLTSPGRAQVHALASVLAVFCGVLCGFAIVASFVPAAADGGNPFGWLLRLCGVEGDVTAGTRMPSHQALLTHEFSLLMGAFGLAFLYRSFAVSLTVAASGALWGAILVKSLGSTTLASAPVVLLGIVPTALLESGALLVAASSAALISRALLVYRLTDERLPIVLRTSLAAFALAGCLSFLASIFEFFVARTLLQ